MSELKISGYKGSNPDDSKRGRFQEYTAEGLGVKTHYYPTTCTARVIAGFGGSDNAWANCNVRGDYDNKFEEVGKWVEYWKEEGIAILTAITTSQQEVGSAVLEAHGFIRSEPILNVRYPKTFLYNWYLPLNGFADEEDMDGEWYTPRRPVKCAD